MTRVRTLSALWRALAGEMAVWGAEEQSAQPHDGEIKAGDVRLGAVCVFQRLMAHLREVRLIGAACAFAILPRLSARLRDVRGLGHERRRRFPHPTWPHPFDPRTAGAALYCPGACRRTAGRWTRLALRPDQQGQSLAVRTRAARDGAGQSAAHEPVAQRRHQDTRRPS